MTATQYVQALGMQPHPEGGYFAETYRSSEVIAQDALPGRFTGSRSFGTAIYFLLESHHVSTLHRIQADEIWHFYAGSPLHVYVIDLEGELSVIKLGPDLAQGEVFQAVVPAGCWFGAKPAGSGTARSAGFSLVGCTVAPGFDFADFEMADRNELLRQYPQHQAIIELLTA
ncbi:hypothetical protein GCM10027341_26190 [Spirosoma knui]